jgi:hypothetical protein
MLNLSKKYPLVFFHIPKNAGKSICDALTIDKEFHPPHLNQTVLLPNDIKNSYTEEKWRGLTKFTIIRNPWARMVSLYHFRKKENDLLIRLQHKGLWEPKNGDSTQKGWDFKKWLLTPEVAGVQNHDVFINFREILKNNPQYSNGFRSMAEYLNQIDLITGLSGELFVDYIIKFENLNNEFNSMFEHLGLEAPKLPVINSSSHKTYNEYYDSETKDFVYNLFKKDINYFNYEF